MNRKREPRDAIPPCAKGGPGGIFLLIAVLLALLLAGCGFRLRGQAQLPPQMAVTYIRSAPPVGAPPSALVDALSQLLETNGVQVTNDPAQATATLEILEQGIRRRTVATAGSEGQTRQYTLTYNVKYRVGLPDGTALIPTNNLSVFRDLLYSEADVLGRAEGEQIALQDMITDMARSILLRLEVLARPG